MARPTPNVLLSHTDQDYNEIEILEAENMFVVLYDDKPFNLRTTKYMRDRTYQRNGFPCQGHATNLAQRLNEIFNTVKFTVKKIG